MQAPIRSGEMCTLRSHALLHVTRAAGVLDQET